MIRRLLIPILASALLPACATTSETGVPVAQPPAEVPLASSAETRVLDELGLQRLLANKGITLQWLGWDQRGSVNARMADAKLLLTGAQVSSKSGGRLFLDGTVEEIGRDYFKFRGTIRIEGTPDAGRICEESKTWHFAVTQNRPYWRLREFEWCDGLTDYIDIYF